MIYVAFSMICLIFGTTFLAIKWGIDAGLTPFFGGGLRFFLAGLILFCFMVWRGKASLSLLLRKEMLLTGLGLTFGTFGSLYWAEQYIASGIAAALTATGPLMILILQTCILHQKSKVSSFVGCTIGFAGVVILLLPALTTNQGGFLWIVACATVLMGEVFYAGGTLYLKQVMPRFQNVSPVALNAVQMMYGGAGILTVSLCTEDIHLNVLLQPHAIYSLIYLIVIGSMVAHTLYYWLVVKTTPLFPSTWLYISPIIAIGLGMVIYNEPISWNMLVGVLIIITGLVLVNASALRQLFTRTRSIAS
ncbi:drug/metabolite transporter (DMT)-like permease [Paenibacillus shirakamiensis]|uniref:Drug/metabolite transporter (DMT)-like permease n=1 Tax=Paenibacillus shirakamiensis TaxID=1265935 RepID=A0ABS4JH09_9BACL|nr:EamA family transporter [Paenibacillus shirakamiensis]MBP2000231.1 drug/metabolite transporter (DMT)-like permease [Paenibacillus shirakamiensis]